MAHSPSQSTHGPKCLVKGVYPEETGSQLLAILDSGAWTPQLLSTLKQMQVWDCCSGRGLGLTWLRHRLKLTQGRPLVNKKGPLSDASQTPQNRYCEISSVHQRPVPLRQTCWHQRPGSLEEYLQATSAHHTQPHCMKKTGESSRLET